jgi:hypothetical protein
LPALEIDSSCQRLEAIADPHNVRPSTFGSQWGITLIHVVFVASLGADDVAWVGRDEDEGAIAVRKCIDGPGAPADRAHHSLERIIEAFAPSGLVASVNCWTQIRFANGGLS